MKDLCLAFQDVKRQAVGERIFVQTDSESVLLRIGKHKVEEKICWMLELVDC